MSLRASQPMPPPPPRGENTQMVDIEQPHKHDVLCGRGVTTNRFPGNESFRSLVSLNKELYVTSTKRQKMSISRSIVEAVRSLKPPGRFLEKNPVTGLWSDIGDRKAIEKTSQALRDGAAGLRKELSEDLGDPDFLSAVFDIDAAIAKQTKAKAASPSAKDKDKPVKAKPVKKILRRAKSNPSVGSKAGAAKALKKQKSQMDSPEKSSRPSSLPPLAPPSPTSPRSYPTSPPRGGWSMRFPPPPGSRSHRGPYPPPPPHPDSVPYKGARPYHRSHSYQMTPHHPPPRPPHAPHTWSHAPPPRYRGPTSPPNVVHTPQSPLPPGRHQLTPNGCISKPPLSPGPPVARWSPRHFPRYPPPYPPHPDYPPGRHDYPPPPGRPDYSRHPEYWPPPHGHPDHHHPHYRGHRDYYHDHHHYPPEGLDVPTLGGERDYHHRPRPGSHEDSVPPQEFSPPVTPSRRRKQDKMSTSSVSSTGSAGSPPKPDPASHGSKQAKTTTPDRMSEDSEGTRNSVVLLPSDKNRSSTKDDATQKTVMSPMSEGASNDVEGVDVEMVDCHPDKPIKVEEQEPPPLKKDVHIISVVHQMDDTTGEVEEGIEFMLKDPTADDYSLSPLPFEREDPTTLMELPDDILHQPISSCGPHDD